MSRLYTPLRACAALLLVGALPAQAATINVTSNADGAPGAACTLRSAVQAANTNTAVGGCVAGDPDGDTITFAPTVLTITLTAGEIRVTDDVTINGSATAGAVRVIIDAAGSSRIFDVNAPAGTGAQRRATFANLVLRNGNSGLGGSSAPDAGGAVDLKDGSQATFTNVDVTGSICGINGGGIHGAGNTDIVIETTGVFTSLIQNNEARGPEPNRGGGGVWGAGTVTIGGNVTITGNRATGTSGSGGGVFNLAGTLTINPGVVISNNTSNRAGGGIETTGGGTVTMTGVTLSGNNAGTAPGNGGGLHVTGADQVTITDGTITGNTAVEGGGLWNSATGTMNVTGTQITTNTATGAAADQGGGGVFSDGGITTLTNLTITGNTATGAAGSGGGVQNTAGGRMTISGGTISNNTSVRAGGGVETNQSGTATGNTLSVTNVTLQGNNAGSSPGFGGGLHITGAAAVTVTGGFFTNNTAVEGGGLWKAAPGTLTISGTVIQLNEATGAAADQGGGGIYSDGGAGLTVSDATISGNSAIGAAGSGGGFLNNVGATSTFINTSFQINSANRAGGAIEDNAGTLLTLTNVTMQNNNAGTAPGNGGALHISGAGTVVMINGTVSGNTAVEGGGLWKSGAGTLTVTGTLIEENTATGASADQGGGGIYNDGAGGMLTLDNVTVTGNTATGASGSGGGLLNNVGGTTSIENSVFNTNTANRAGGGIEDNAGGMITINQSSFDANVTGSAPGNGGALHITGAGTVVMDSSSVTANQASNQGGGLWNSGAGALTVRYTDISGNQSGTGGGVYQLAGDTGLIRIANSLVAGNTASAAGGGLAADGATVVIENSTVSGNTAATAGGGLASGGGRFLVSSATIAFNQAATSGGGLFRIPAGGDSLLSLDNTIVSDNTAPTGANLSGVVMSRGYNLFRTTDGGTVVMDAGAGPDLTGVDPQLQPLADNGGPTRTHAVLETSPIIVAGMTSLDIDQRGFVRGKQSTIGAYQFGTGSVAGEGVPAVATEFALSAPTPNPFRSRTTMRVSTPTAEAIEVVMYDALGRRVQTLYSGTPGAGATMDLTVDAGSLAPGVYVVRMTGATQATTQRITVTR